MSDIQTYQSSLPSIEKARAMLERCRSSQEVMRIRALAQAVASCAASESAKNEASAIVLLAKARIGELTAAMAATPNDGSRRNQVPAGNLMKRDALAAEGLSRKDAAECEKLADLKRSGDLDRMIRKPNGAVTTAAALTIAKMAPAERRKVFAKLGDDIEIRKAIADVKIDTVRAGLESVSAREVKAAKGVYDVVVIDPPWPMEKIEREVRPNQVAFDYPVMTEAELGELAIPVADDAHVWCWTTHRFLPMALRLLDAWRLSYVCAFVWHKAGGFQPVGLPQFNCEFALYARRGSPRFLDTKAFPVCFEAGRTGHSEKPDAFYDVVRRVTGGRRLDMFNRRAIEGFDGWGKEAV